LLEARWFALVDELAVSESRRRRFRPEDADEFRSYLRLRFAERGDRILAAHDGRSSLDTYLLVIVVRMLRDWQRAIWGHWRPSAEALRLGDVAVELDRRMSHLGESFESAAAELVSRFGPRASRAELERILPRLPQRRPREAIAVGALDDRRAADGAADETLNARERAELARRLGPLARQALRALDPVDRLVLTLVFRDGLSVRAVSRAVGLTHKTAGRRLDRALRRLREAMEEGGVDRHGALLLLEVPPGGDEGWLLEIADPGGDNPAPRPSTQEAER